MKVSLKGTLEICEHEGIVPTVYRDSQRVLTYGVGHTKNAGGVDPRKMSMAMPSDIDAAVDNAIEVFRQDLTKYAARVNRAIKVGISQHEFDALVSFDFNTGGIHRAKLTQAINNGDKEASKRFFGWMRPPEIQKRRRAEERLFRTGDYDHNGNTIPIWGTNGNGRLTGIIDQMSGEELLDRLRGPMKPEPTEDIPWFVSLVREFFT